MQGVTPHATVAESNLQVLQCVQCVAVCCSALRCVAVRCSALQCVVVCCSVLQCVAVLCSVLQCVKKVGVYSGCFQVAMTHRHIPSTNCGHDSDNVSLLCRHTATHCNALQCTAMYCNALQCTAPHCNTLQKLAPHCNTLQKLAPRNNPS